MTAPARKSNRPATRAATCATALLALGLASCPASGADLAAHAARFRLELVDKVMPYWHDTAVDKERGGYLLSDDAARPGRPATEKQLVSQARMIWGFSHAHLNQLGDGKRDYLKAAEQGRRFLSDHFLDREHGGYFWTTDPSGKTLDARKIVYGEAFVIYALVEWHRASGDRSALAQAMDLYRVLQERAHDPKHGGWNEHFERDWTPLKPKDPSAMVEVAGYKSANTHLHLMEAFTELYDVTRDPAVKKSLEESLRINQKYFYPKDAGRSCFHRQPDWRPVTDPASAGLSYGHNVEFAWLMVRAEKALGRRPSWGQFDAHVEHALKYGYDHARGGLGSRGVDDQPATDMDKIWWVQSEMLAALTEGLARKPNPAYARAMESLIVWIRTYQADPKDGIWLDTVTADGRPKAPGKAHNWKANYHDVRALVKFVNAFENQSNRK